MHDLPLLLYLNISDITIITVINVDHGCIIHNISKSIKKLCPWRWWVYMKNIFLNFSLFQTIFFYFFLFSIYKMVDIVDIYKSLKFSIGTVMKNPEMLKFVPDRLKTKKCVSM